MARIWGTLETLRVSLEWLLSQRYLWRVSKSMFQPIQRYSVARVMSKTHPPLQVKLVFSYEMVRKLTLGAHRLLTIRVVESLLFFPRNNGRSPGLHGGRRPRLWSVSYAGCVKHLILACPPVSPKADVFILFKSFLILDTNH